MFKLKFDFKLYELQNSLKIGFEYLYINRNIMDRTNFQLKNPDSGRVINPVGVLARKIYKAQIEGGRKPEDILPPGLLWNSSTKRFRTRKEKTNPNVRLITYDEIDRLPVEKNSLNYMKDIFNQYRGQTIEVAKKYY